MKTDMTESPNRPPVSPSPPQASVEARVWSGDSTQKISHDSTGQIRISGLANGRTPDPRVNLYFDRIDVNVALNEGMTPYETFQALTGAMPKGYRTELALGAPHSHGDVLFEVRRS